MPRNKTPIALAPLERILKENGAKRVSDDALKSFAEYLDRHARDIASRSIEFSKHSGRRTVMKEDVVLAEKNI